MNWLGDFIKTFINYFSTIEGIIVLIVILLTAIVTTILTYAIPAFGRFLLRFPKKVWRSLQMFKKWYRDWHYWRRFGAKYKILSIGNLQIETGQNASDNPKSILYTFTLMLTLEFENRDDLSKMLVDCRDMLLRVDSQVGNGKRILPYYLTPMPATMTFWILPNGKPVERKYIFNYSTDEKPRLGNVAVCRVIRFGSISVGGVTRTMKARLFDVKVDWLNLKPLISHKEGSQI